MSHMFSNHVSSDASAYCHGELSVDDARKFAEHILVCSKCRNEFEQIKFGVLLAAQLPAEKAPDYIWSRLETQLERQQNSRFESVAASRDVSLTIANCSNRGNSSDFFCCHKHLVSPVKNWSHQAIVLASD